MINLPLIVIITLIYLSFGGISILCYNLGEGENNKVLAVLFLWPIINIIFSIVLIYKLIYKIYIGTKEMFIEKIF